MSSISTTAFDMTLSSLAESQSSDFTLDVWQIILLGFGATFVCLCLINLIIFCRIGSPSPFYLFSCTRKSALNGTDDLESEEQVMSTHEALVNIAHDLGARLGRAWSALLQRFETIAHDLGVRLNGAWSALLETFEKLAYNPHRPRLQMVAQPDSISDDEEPWTSAPPVEIDIDLSDDKIELSVFSPSNAKDIHSQQTYETQQQVTKVPGEDSAVSRKEWEPLCNNPPAESAEHPRTPSLVSPSTPACNETQQFLTASREE